MARIRSIKPEFWTSEQIVECSPIARLLFVGIWTFADDGGVHPASVKRLKMEVFPGDTIDDQQLAAMVAELIDNGLLIEFQVGKDLFWHVPKWEKHQKIDRPTLKYPRPDDKNSTITRRAFVEESPSPRDGTERNGEERNGFTEEEGIPFILKDGKDWLLTREKLEEYRKSFTEIDVDAEIRAARQWCIDNPTKRKTAAGMPRYLTNWLSPKVSGTKKTGHDWSRITDAILRSPSQLIEWFDKQSVIPSNEENRRWCLAVAKDATGPGLDNPSAVFVAAGKKLSAGERKPASDGSYDWAKSQLRLLQAHRQAMHQNRDEIPVALKTIGTIAREVAQ